MFFVLMICLEFKSPSQSQGAHLSSLHKQQHQSGQFYSPKFIQQFFRIWVCGCMRIIKHGSDTIMLTLPIFCNSGEVMEEAWVVTRVPQVLKKTPSQWRSWQKVCSENRNQKKRWTMPRVTSRIWFCDNFKWTRRYQYIHFFNRIKYYNHWKDWMQVLTTTLTFSKMS